MVVTRSTWTGLLPELEAEARCLVGSGPVGWKKSARISRKPGKQFLDAALIPNDQSVSLKYI